MPHFAINVRFVVKADTADDAEWNLKYSLEHANLIGEQNNIIIHSADEPVKVKPSQYRVSAYR